MRLLHRIRLNQSDAAELDFAYRAVQTISAPRLRAGAERGLSSFVSQVCARRLPDALPPSWQWAYQGTTLYLFAP